MTEVFDATACLLGESPIWHPTRQQLLWVDIDGKQLLGRKEGDAAATVWHFEENVSAAGWVDDTRMFLASDRALFTFDLETGAREHLAALEADTPQTRANDGRADPWGGFWIGTMGRACEPGAGAFYRYYKGELRKLVPGITIPNGLAFDPDGVFAIYVDTAVKVIQKQRLSETDGWPIGAPEPFIDLSGVGWGPDGAVFDRDGLMWHAQWGNASVGAYDRAGALVRTLPVDALHASCPAFGGPDMRTLFCTSARADVPAEELDRNPSNGMTFRIPDVATGVAEPKVLP